MTSRALLFSLPLTLAACSVPLGFGTDTAPAPPEVQVFEAPGDDITRPRARLRASAEAPPAPAVDGFLGETLAGLGAPSEVGLWLRTGLVSANTPGRIVTEDGRGLAVELRASAASAGAGSQISLMAMQALGLGLGQLAPLRVYVISQ